MSDAATPIDFAALRPSAVLERMGALSSWLDAQLGRLAAAPLDLETLITFLDAVPPAIDDVVCLAEHMEESTGLATWSAAHETVAKARLELSERLFAFVGQSGLLGNAAATAPSDGPRARVLAGAVRASRHAGAGLSGASQGRLAELDERLVSLTTAFSRRLDEETQAFTFVVSDPSALRGLPAWCVERARATAEARGVAGHVLTGQQRVVDALLRHAEDRELRRTFYLAQNTRGVDPPDTRSAAPDNVSRVDDILAPRAERAALLGYASFADLTLDGRMESAASALALLDRLRERLAEPFRRETSALLAVGRAQGCEELQVWDVSFFAERERQAVCAYDEEAVRQYFPYAAVFAAVRALTARMFEIDWRKVDAPTWHPTVTAWEVSVRRRPLALLYVDSFAREGKREGAWMTPLAACVPGRPAGALVVTNDFAGSGSGEATSLGLDDVRRLLHEIGHAMHHVLSTTRWESLSGTKVAWDFVEFPSTVFEKLLDIPGVLERLSSHIRTGAPLPADLVERCLSARRFRTASMLMQGVGLAAIDLALHSSAPRPLAVLRAREQMQPFAPVALPATYARFASLRHVFGTTRGYEASLYAYVAADELAEQAIARLGTSWEDLPRGGARFRDLVLARGNEAPPRQLVDDFTRG